MRREIMVLLLWLLICLYFSIESWRLGLGSITAPGPGFLPFWVSVIIGVLTVVQLSREIGKKLANRAMPLFRGKRIQNILYALGFLFAYPLLFDKIGFFLDTLLFTGACLRVIGGRKWMVVVCVGILVVTVAYVVFVIWLRLQLPEGRWVMKILSLVRSLLWN